MVAAAIRLRAGGRTETREEKEEAHPSLEGVAMVGAGLVGRTMKRT